MNLTREKALELHRQMWSDMQRDLGDNPTEGDRIKYKFDWCHKHFPKESISVNCFLCEYADIFNLACCECPIVWPFKYCAKYSYCYTAPISEILALPERGEK